MSAPGKLLGIPVRKYIYTKTEVYTVTGDMLLPTRKLDTGAITPQEALH